MEKIPTQAIPIRCSYCNVDLNYYEHDVSCTKHPSWGSIPKFEGELLAANSNAGIKHDSGKPRMELLDPIALEQLAAVLTFGATKYSANNWRKGINSSRLLAAALRHIFAYMRGQVLDEESNLPHLAHAMCCLMFAINLAITKPELTDHCIITKE